MSEHQPSAAISDSVILQLSADIVSASLRGPQTSMTPEALPDFIRSIYSCLKGLSKTQGVEPEARLRPAVPISQSIHKDYIVCLEDGRKLKMLKRHLQTSYNLTPDSYRVRWGLPLNYPMVARSYSSRRSALAKDIGLGREKTVKQSLDIIPPPIEVEVIQEIEMLNMA